MRIRIAAIQSLAEFERIGWDWEASSENEVRLKCPAHKDDTPSVSFNTKTNVWRCHATQCGAKGDIVTFIGYVLKAERTVVVEDLRRRCPELEDAKCIDPSLVEKYHKRLGEAGPLWSELEARGVTKDMARSARLGFSRGRITIPVYDLAKRVVNIRRYLPGASGEVRKMTNTRGYGTPPRLYQIDQLRKFDRIWVCGGEIKALVVAWLLNPLGIGAVSVTAGEGTWDTAWNSLFDGKTVFVCMDVDEAGRSAAKSVCVHLQHAQTKEVFDILLPLDTGQYPKGDVNDYVGSGAGATELVSLMEGATEFVPPVLELQRAITGDAKSIELEQSIHAGNVARLLTFPAMVSGFMETPFFVPSKVTVDCDRSQQNCALCPIYSHDDKPSIEIHPHSEAFLSIIHAPAKAKREALMSAIGIPPCRSVRFHETERKALYDVRLSPPLRLSTSGNLVRVPAFMAGDRVECNVPYQMEGVTYPHPATQSAILVVGDAKPADDSLATFQPSEKQLDELRVFQPTEWSVDGITARMDAIYRDLSHNVTGIFGRDEMHLMMDLTWHSPLWLTFEGRQLKGWLNVLIIGDSGCGKSAAAERLLDHYKLGERVECKNATAAGLIGGLEQVGNQWFVTWNVIPQQDRRLVVLDEVKGLRVSEIGKMTDMRSSGFAELPKIKREKVSARTRLLFMSNPRPERRTMASYTHGVDAMVELVGGFEDLRRFDAVSVVAREQVTREEINRPIATRDPVEHWVTSELSRRLILFAWTRKGSEVRLTDEAAEAIQRHSMELGKTFTDRLPILDRGTTREKLGRLAAALAARTYSTEGGVIRIRDCHVDYIAKMLRRVYDSREVGYGAYSRALSQSHKIHDENDVVTAIKTSKYPQDAVRALLREEEMSHEDVAAFFGLDREEGQDMVSLLLRKHCIARAGRRAFRKTEAFITLLRRLDNSGTLAKENEDEF